MTEVTCPTCRKQHYIKLYDELGTRIPNDVLISDGHNIAGTNHGYIAIEEKYCSTDCWDKEEAK